MDPFHSLDNMKSQYGPIAFWIIDSFWSNSEMYNGRNRAVTEWGSIVYYPVMLSVILSIAVFRNEMGISWCNFLIV